jgi:hypothetical protein
MKTIKILQDTGISNNFLTRTPKPYEISVRIDKGDLTKFKGFCMANGKN